MKHHSLTQKKKVKRLNFHNLKMYECKLFEKKMYELKLFVYSIKELNYTIIIDQRLKIQLSLEKNDRPQ